jgi:molybdenum cofactor cytidylyltransferase
MGRPKLSLPLAERTVIEHTIGTLRRAGIDKILVVVGPHGRELAILAERSGAVTLLLTRETLDMRATVVEGLKWAEDHWQPAIDDAFLLVPADHPSLEAVVIQSIADRYTALGHRSIIVPTFDGRRGHPAIIGWHHVAGIRNLRKELGLNFYLREHADETFELPVESDSILVDLDTPEDYEQLKAKWRDGNE